MSDLGALSDAAKDALRDRIRSSSIVDESTGCWVWQGYTQYDGYGRIRLREPRRMRLSHRIAYELWRGPIPEGLETDHLCRNRSCVNPDHLEAVTRRENLLRGVGASHRAARTNRCVSGNHALIPENTIVYPKSGKRVCRACREVYMREYRKRRAA